MNADLDRLKRIVPSSAVFLDTGTRLTPFSPDALSIFRLRAADLGRPLSDLNHTLDCHNLLADLRRTLIEFIGIGREVAGPGALPGAVPARSCAIVRR